MKRIIILAALLTIGFAQATAEESWTDHWKKTASDYLTMPSMPDFSILDLSKMSEQAAAQANMFVQQLNDSLPLLEQMGYEVSVINVQWAIPPKLKVRLRSKTGTQPAKAFEPVTAPNQSLFVKTLIWSAAEAKRIQGQMNVGTAIVDVDFAIPPRIKMSFLKQRHQITDLTLEDLDLSCVQD
jgi:hypothetical protein